MKTACTLFYREGFRAVGIDRIIEEASVAKMSFYRYFPSKSDLIAAFLRKRHDDWMAWFTADVEVRIAAERSGLEVIAETLRSWFRQPDFRGCAFINTVAETSDHSSELARIAREHKADLEVFIEKLAARLSLPAPKETAAAAMIIVEGAIVRAQITGNPEIASACKPLLAALGAGGGLTLSSAARSQSR